MRATPSPAGRCSWHQVPRIALVLIAATLTVASVSSCSASSGSGAPVAPDGSTPSSSQAPSAPLAPSSDTYPNAIAVLGHSGTTGYNSDPASPGTDAHTNSWATGENPAVQSIYSRLVALNPAVTGHATNLGVDGSDVTDLADQVDRALALDPVPDLFMIQEVDNDLQCDGSDTDNYAAFAQTLRAQLDRITATAPGATILLVSSPPGTVQNYGEVVAALPEAKANSTGTGPCDLFNPSGEPVAAHWTYQDTVIKAYQAQLALVCTQTPGCVYDNGALYRMPITAEDLAPDGEHLSIAGHAKQAALEWKVLGLDA